MSKKNQELNENAAPEKKKKKGSKWIYDVLMVICLGVFCFSGYKLYEIWHGRQVVEQETQELSQFLYQPAEDEEENGSDKKKDSETSKPVQFKPDWAALQAINPHICGWIIIPGTSISFPIVQGPDNDYYLNHTIKGESNRLGSIFMDYEADPQFRDDNTIIYGHSVDTGGMFTEIKNYKDETVFEDYPYFWILTPNGNYQVQIMSFYQGKDDGAVYTTSFGDYRKEVIETILNQATHARGIDGDGTTFVTLSTCNMDYGLHSDQRYVLFGQLVPYDKPIMVESE